MPYEEHPGLRSETWGTELIRFRDNAQITPGLINRFPVIPRGAGIDRRGMPLATACLQYGSGLGTGALSGNVGIAELFQRSAFANEPYFSDLDDPIRRERIDSGHFGREDVVIVPLAYRRIDEREYRRACHDETEHPVPHPVKCPSLRIADQDEGVVRPEDAHVGDRDEEQERRRSMHSDVVFAAVPRRGVERDRHSHNAGKV